MSEITRRMNALSSTTSTLAEPSEKGWLTTHHAHGYRAPRHVEPDRPAALAAHRFAHNRDARSAERNPAGDDVPLAHSHGAGRDQRREHRGTSHQPGRGTSQVGAVPLE